MLFTTRTTKSTRVKIFPFIFTLLCILLTSVAYADQLTVDTTHFTYENGIYSKSCVGRCIMYYTVCKEPGQPPMLAHEFYSTSGQQLNQEDVITKVETHYRANSEETWLWTEPILLRSVMGQIPNGNCLDIRFMFQMANGVDALDYVPVYDRPYSEYAVFLNLNDQMAYYTLDDNVVTVEDISSSKANGTRNGTPVFTTEGIINGAYNFTSGDYLDLTDRSDFTFSNGGGDDSAFSISLWVKPETATPPSASVIIGKDTFGSFREWVMYLSSSNRLQFYILDAQNDRKGGLSPPGIFTAHQWHHVVWTYNGTESEAGMLLYVNNQSFVISPDSAGSYDGMQDTNTPVTVASTSVPSFYFAGIVDEIAIFNASLTVEQIAELYNDGQGFQYPYSLANDSNVTNDTGNITNATGVIVNIDTTEIADSIELLVYIGLLCILAIGSIITRVPFMYIVTGLFGIVIGYTFIENTTIALIIMIASGVFMLFNWQS